jgi:hypothetical protein
MPTPIPGPTGPRFRVEYNAAAGVDMIVDTYTHVGATTGAYEVGDVDRSNVYVPFGHYFFWVLAQEENFGIPDFMSSPDDFALQGSDGTIYTPEPAYPVDQPDSDNPMEVAVAPRNQKNSGWLQFTVPARADAYTVLWSDGGPIPFLPMGKVKIEAGVPYPSP